MKLSTITESTLIPLSVMAVIAGGVFWLSALHSQTFYNTQQIDEIKTTLETFSTNREIVIDRLARIEQKLDILAITSYDQGKKIKK